MKKTALFFITIILSSLITFGCNSVKSVPEDLTAAQIIQQGQNAYSAGDYKTAEMYYDAVIDRYGDDVSVYVEARYELGHLYLKTKDYKKAYSAFTEIIDLYDSTSYGVLPPSYKKLSQIGISRIPENKQKN